MRAVILEIDEGLLEERRRLGLDVFDEMWEGVLHTVPPPLGYHQGVGTKLLLVLAPLAQDRGLEARYETGLFRPGTDVDYRIPDLMFASPARLTRRGVDGAAELVVEILSPGDESHAKLDWYAALGVAEMLIVDPDTLAVELFRGTLEGPAQVGADDDGALRSEVLGVNFTTIDRRLLITWDGGQADVTSG